MDSDMSDDFNMFELDQDFQNEKPKNVSGLKKLREGGQAFIYEAYYRGQRVAIKSFACNKTEGVSRCGMNEASIIKEINIKKHINIINIIDIYFDQNNLNIVYEFCSTDLHEFIYSDEELRIAGCDERKYTSADIKCMMKMILEGLAHLHANNIIHNDIKPENILIGDDLELKICDFGISRLCLYNDPCSIKNTTTIFYRPPEILLKARSYDRSVDIWGVGCIFAELIRRQRLFAHTGVSGLDGYYIISGKEPTNLKKYFDNISDDEVEFLQSLLVLNPQKRITAKEALDHPYFKKGPEPSRNWVMNLSSNNKVIPSILDTPDRYDNKRPAGYSSLSSSPSHTKKAKF